MRDQLRNHLIAEEGKRKKVYLCTAGKNTCGIGRNLDDVGLTPEEEKHLGCTAAEIIAGHELTDGECFYLLDNDIDRVSGQLDKALPWWVSRSDSTRVGMGSMCFQMGLGGLLEFKRMLACLQAGDYQGAQKHGLDSKWAREDSPERAKRVVELFKP